MTNFKLYKENEKSNLVDILLILIDLFTDLERRPRRFSLRQSNVEAVAINHFCLELIGSIRGAKKNVTEIFKYRVPITISSKTYLII